METIWEILRRVAYLFSRNRRSLELADEMAFHREMNERAGRTGAGRSFGNPALLREQAREAWGWMWIDRFGQDLRYAARMLARSPGFSASAVLVLALGMGTNIFMFSAMDWAFFQYLPLRDPGSLVSLERQSPEAAAYAMPYPTAAYYGDHARTLSAVMTMTSGRLELDSEAKALNANYVSANYFRELGASAVYGRLLDPLLDNAQSTSPAVVLGNDFWKRNYNADPLVVGRTIRLNHQPATIVGVEPYGFPGLGNTGDSVDIWLSINQQPYFVAGSTLLTDTAHEAVQVWGRLAPGISAQKAAEELLSLTNTRRNLYPKETWKDEFIRLEPAGHTNVLNARSFQGLSIVAALGLLVLMMTCANLGGLLLARGVVRQHEVAIRIAIGADRKRIFRQLFTESLLLALLGSGAGLALACAALKSCLLYFGRPTWVSAAPDWRVCLFLLAMAFFAAIFFGLAPALQLARQQQKRTRARQILVAIQVAASCLLVIVSSLLVRSAQHTIFTKPGFGYEQVLSIDPALAYHGYGPAVAKAFLEQMESRFNALPAVTSMALVRHSPLKYGSVINLEVRGKPVTISRNWVDTRFFETMDIPMLLGRSFTQDERDVVIVSQSLASALWPRENPLGRVYSDKKGVTGVVVGVVGDAPVNSPSDGNVAQMYARPQLEDMNQLSVIVKSRGAPDMLIPILKASAQRIDPRIFPEINLLRSAYRRKMQAAEEMALMMSLIGMAATLLAGLGILGLVAYTVSQRNKEIAIRLALGSPKIQVMLAVVRQFTWPVMIGIAAGTGTAVALSQVLRRILSGISGLDPVSYAGALTMLMGTFAVAAFLPTRRALELDVARALHEQQ